MPLPWLIAAAAVAATAAVVKAFSDDDSPSTSKSSSSKSSTSDTRATQERTARLQHERHALESRLVNLKSERLENARTTLKQSFIALGKSPGSVAGLTVSQFKQALSGRHQASSVYAQALGEALSIVDYSQKGCSHEDRNQFLGNLRVHELLQWSIELSDQERKDLLALSQASAYHEKLQRLKHKLEQHG